MLDTRKNLFCGLPACTLLGLLFIMQGCPAVAIAIYAAYNDEGDIAITVEIPRSAPDVFAAAKKRAEQGISRIGIPFKVTHIDEDNYTLGFEGTDGSWQAEFVVIPIGASKSQILAQGTDENRHKDESEYLVLQGVENLCKDLGVEYTVVGRRLSN